MNLLIINQPLNNRGDESAHKALLRTLVRQLHDVKIRVLFLRKFDDSIRQFSVKDDNIEYVCIPGKHTRILRDFCLKYGFYFLWRIHPTFRKVMDNYSWSDVVICAPGGICMGGFQNWGHLFFLKIAQLMNKKLVYYGRSFGPFPTKTRNNILFKNISLQLLNYFSFCSIRDSKTEILAKELHVNYIKTVDTAFLESPKFSIPNEIYSEIGDDYIVFVPNLLIWHYAYKNIVSKNDIIAYASKIISVISSKYPKSKIVLLPQTFNYNTYNGDDIHFFYDLKNCNSEKNLYVVPDTYSSDIQQSIISNCKFVVGGRYHSVVFAINQSKPVIALSYEHKIAGLLDNLGLNNSIVDITHAFDNLKNMENSIYRINYLLDNLEQTNQACIEAKKIANHCFECLVNFLKNK